MPTPLWLHANMLSRVGEPDDTSLLLHAHGLHAALGVGSLVMGRCAGCGVGLLAVVGCWFKARVQCGFKRRVQG